MKSFRVLTNLASSSLLILSLFQVFSLASQERQPSSPPKVIIRGFVACLDESGKRLSADKDCNQASPNYELLTKDGKRYHFSPDDLIIPIFTESKVRRQELQIQALLHEKNLLELEKVQAVKEAKVYDIYYFCEVCNITAYGPGPCPCCYEPFHFIEKPAN
jgi:rubrerythrin